MEQTISEFSFGLFVLQIFILVFIILLGYFVYKIYKKIK
jgi:hypothetical protein